VRFPPLTVDVDGAEGRLSCIGWVKLIRLPSFCRAVAWFLLAIAIAFAAPGVSAEAADTSSARLVERVRTAGTLRVIVNLRLGAEASSPASPQAIAGAQERLAQRLWARGHSLPGWQVLRSISVVMMEVDASLLAALLADPEVESIEEDRLAKPHVDDDAHEIGINAVGPWGLGYTGVGRAIAILDTGVDRTHPYLGGRVVAEACFSTSVPFFQVNSLCPNGEMTQIGPGAAAPCSGYSHCAHGTQVAGIAAGFESLDKSGIAPGAQIIAIQVYSRVTDPAVCGGQASCIRSYASDRLRALDHVYSLRNAHAIAAVNLSLGGTTYPSQASCDAANSTTKQAIDQLRAIGIASVAATGNDGLRDLIAEPACISSVISVATSYDLDDVGTQSNLAPYVTTFGYGGGLSSSIPGGGFGPLSGTSASAAQIAGGIAVLRQANSEPSVGDMIAVMRSTGRGIGWGRGGGNPWVEPIAFRRLNLHGALAAFCKNCPIPSSGWWWNPRESGRGFAIETRLGRAFVGTFLYDDEGAALWFVGNLSLSGTTFSGLLAKFASGQTLGGAHKSPRVLGFPGNATLTFSSPTSGTLTWPGGTIPIERFPIDDRSVASAPAGAPETGWWWDESHQGTGWFFEVQGSRMFLVGYLYDAAGKPIWYVSGGPMLTSTAYDGELRLYGGGQTLAGDYKPPSNYASIGGISVRFSSRTGATLTLPQGQTIPLTRFNRF
jgi:subtilisin